MPPSPLLAEEAGFRINAKDLEPVTTGFPPSFTYTSSMPIFCIVRKDRAVLAASATDAVEVTDATDCVAVVDFHLNF